VPHESGKPNRKLPERDDALKIDLPFDEALLAALKTPPETRRPKRKSSPTRRSSNDVRDA